jgi:hypothetical protein
MNASEDSPWSAILERLDLRSLPNQFRPDQLFLICRGTDGANEDDVAWVTRASAEFNREEFLGALTVYLEHMKQELAADWLESDSP